MASCTKTVVFTDLVGYTNLTATISREELEQLAQEHEEHTLRVFEPYGGELVTAITLFFFIGAITYFVFN